MLLSVWLENVQDSLRCHANNIYSHQLHAVFEQCKVVNICRGLQNEVKCEIRLEKLSDDRLILTGNSNPNNVP